MKAYQLTLLEIFEQRRMRNRAYSLRAFARSCGVSPASLSQVLSGKRRLTLKSAKRIAERLAFAPDEHVSFLATAAPKLDPESRELGPRDQLGADRFHLVADWFHYAILSLGELPGHRATPEWIAEKLDISRKDAETALRRLVSLGLLSIKNGRMKQTSCPLVSTDDIPSAALRRHHKQLLERAATSLETVSVEWREFGAMTMALDPKKLPQAKRLVRRFRQQLASLCETGDPRLVYHFCTQLFPVSAPEKFIDPKESCDENEARS
jgi:transcriptional regulator with XRE-family HTH domain